VPGRRRTPPSDRVRRIVEQLQAIERISPTAAELFVDWIDRLLAGEPLESVKPEMDRLNELFDAARKRQTRRPRRK
jgi:hypothetical protein